MVCPVKRVKLSLHGGEVLVFGFLTLVSNKVSICEFVFPQEIDDYIVQAKERGYETVVNFGRQGLAFAATAAVTAAVKVTVQLRVLSSVALKPMDKVGWLFIPDHYKILAEFCFLLIFVILERTSR